MSQSAGLDRLDRAIVDAFQGGFPVVEAPFEPAAAALRERGVEDIADGVVARVRGLEVDGVRSRFGASVDARAIPGAASLVAMHAPEDRFEQIVERVNAHREVPHDYPREYPQGCRRGRLGDAVLDAVPEEDRHPADGTDGAEHGVTT